MCDCSCHRPPAPSTYCCYDCFDPNTGRCYETEKEQKDELCMVCKMILPVPHYLDSGDLVCEECYWNPDKCSLCYINDTNSDTDHPRDDYCKKCQEDFPPNDEDWLSR